MTYQIALVDDDQNILTSVSIALEAEGFEVQTFNEGEKAVLALQDQAVDLVVLDMKMPRMDGIEVLKKLKEKQPLMPIVFLTSKDDEIDQLLGLKMGADDYITKPFSQRLLIERIRVILRRHASAMTIEQTPDPDADKVFQHGNLKLDDERHLCFWSDHLIDVTVTEYLLVKCLAKKPGHVKSRDQLIDFAYGESIYVDDRTVDSHIKRIRKKFKKRDDSFSNIETVYGIGYRYKE